MKTDVFISYRQEGAADLAQLIFLALSNEGYRVFLDKDGLGSGEYGIKLFSRIRDCKDFLLILPPRALDRCKDEEDWVRLEIECALQGNKHIIPIWMPGFDRWPEDLPASMARVTKYTALKYYRDYVPELLSKLKSPGFLLSSPDKISTPIGKTLPTEYCEEPEGLIYVKKNFRCPECGSRRIQRKDKKECAILLLDGIRESMNRLLTCGAAVVIIAGILILTMPELRVWLESLILKIPYIARDYFETDTPLGNWWKILLLIYAGIALFATIIIYCAEDIRDPMYDKELAEGPHTVECVCKNCGMSFWAVSSEKLLNDWVPEES